VASLISTVTSKGQMTMPAEIRRRLNLKAGDRVEFVVAPDGRVSLRALNLPTEALFGMLSHLKPDPTYRDDDAAIADQVVAEDEATKSPRGRRRAA
jgi:antitoxin PrlF